MSNGLGATRMKAPARLLTAAVALAAIVLLVVLFLSGGARSSRDSLTLEVVMRASGGTAAQLFWSADHVFSGDRSSSVPLRPDVNGLQTLRFDLPSRGIAWLRFDLTDTTAEVMIQRMVLLDKDRRVLREFEPSSLTPLYQIASITKLPNVTRVVTTADATDPMLLTMVGCLPQQDLRDRLTRVTPAAIALASLATLVLLGACVLVIGRDALGAPPADAAGAHRPSRRLALLWIAVLFLVAFSAKLLLMRQNPVTTPFWDQWDSEARLLYVPLEECALSWPLMFSLHNEHRVFFSRLLAADLLMANGQWDPRLQQVVNAALHTFAGVLLATVLWNSTGRRRLDIVVLVVALAFALPFAWENTLFGFQSAFYFLSLFSILGLWFTSRYRAGTGPWFLGVACAVCALFTAAGGVILPVIIATVAASKMADERKDWRDAGLTLAAIGCVLAAGWLTMSPPLAHHEHLRARSVAEFASAFGRSLAWPWVGRPWLSVVMWAPTVAVMLGVLRRSGKSTPGERFVLGLGLWVVFQAAAVAYGRGAGGPPPASRYQDFLSVGFVVNASAFVLVLERFAIGTMRRGLSFALPVWLLFAAAGADRLTLGTLAHLDAWRPYWSAHASNVRHFIVTGDLDALLSKRPLQELPYPDPRSLGDALQIPYVRRILPAAVRAPVHVEAQSVTNDTFAPDGAYKMTPRDPLARFWGSYTAQGEPATGRFESTPLARCSTGGYLRFDVAGDLTARRQYLAVKDLGSDHERHVPAPRPNGDNWVPARVPCPPGAYSIVAVDSRNDHWFAFREPVEEGRVSPLVEWMIASSPQALIVALALALVAARLT